MVTMETILPILLILTILAPICWAWVDGIDYMDKNHPDYTGDDLFGIDEKNNSEKA